MKANPELLMVKHGEGHPTERASLHGKRFVVAIETEEGRRLNETMVKEFTGGDRISARRMREDPWEFDPTHKIMLCTNHKPVVRGTDFAIWRRLKMIPFSVIIPKEQRDKNLPAKLAAELPGILAWCVKGCLDWQAYGLEEPSEVTEATDAYKTDQDTLGAFIAEHCVLNQGIQVRAGCLHEKYREWAEKSGERSMSLKAFGQEIIKRGFEKTMSNGTWYRGLGLASKTTTEPVPVY